MQKFDFDLTKTSYLRMICNLFPFLPSSLFLHYPYLLFLFYTFFRPLLLSSSLPPPFSRFNSISLLMILFVQQHYLKQSREINTNSDLLITRFPLSVYIYIHIYHHHHVVPLARIFLTVSRHFSPSFIASGRSSGLNTIFSHSCCMYVRAGRSDFDRPYVGVHRSTTLMSSSLLLQLCPTCLVRLTWIVFGMEGRWPYSWCLVGCCRQDLFNFARSILV